MLEMVAQALRMMPTGAQAALAAAPAQPIAAARTLADWLDVHDGILLTRGYKDQTIKNRRSNLAHVRRLWGSVPVTELRPHVVASALRTFPKDRSSTAVRVLAELRDAYVEAIANGWAETSPAAHIKPPKHKVMRGRLELDVWMQMRALSTTSPQRWVESRLLLGLAIGQRRADLSKVRFDDVVDGHLRIEQQKEAGKGYGARVEIPLTLRMDCLGMTVGDVIEHCRQSAKPGPTLLRKANGQPIEMSSLSARFCEHIKAVLGDKDPGMHRRPSLHETRSLSARTYVAQGLNPKVVQTLLGHKDIEMTELYLNDRGLSAAEWKRVATPCPQITAET
jgi:site-specific recombinase XerD